MCINRIVYDYLDNCFNDMSIKKINHSKHLIECVGVVYYQFIKYRFEVLLKYTVVSCGLGQQSKLFRGIMDDF